jgi:hypothetical protein
MNYNQLHYGCLGRPLSKEESLLPSPGHLEQSRQASASEPACSSSEQMPFSIWLPAAWMNRQIIYGV